MVFTYKFRWWAHHVWVPRNCSFGENAKCFRSVDSRNRQALDDRPVCEGMGLMECHCKPRLTDKYEMVFVPTVQSTFTSVLV